MAEYWFRCLSDWVAVTSNGLSVRRCVTSLEDVIVAKIQLLNFYFKLTVLHF